MVAVTADTRCRNLQRVRRVRRQHGARHGWLRHARGESGQRRPDSGATNPAKHGANRAGPGFRGLAAIKRGLERGQVGTLA